QNVVQHRLFDIDAALARLIFEDRRVCASRGRLDASAVTHASQERLVGEILLIQVRRKDDELFEWDFDLLACVQRKVIDASFQRYDPAVKEILRRNTLTSEVVDNQ